MQCFKGLVLAGVVAVLITAGLTRAQGQISPDLEKSCRAYVQGFYDWYLPIVRREGGDPTKLALRRYRFGANLVRQLNEDAAAQAKAKGDLVGLEFDPFINAQDVVPGRYTAGKVIQKGTTYLVEVSIVESGKPVPPPWVVPELTYQGGQWYFVNFHYGQGKDETDLLTTLKQLREDRKNDHD